MDKASGTVLDFFTTVEDPRQRGKVLYRLDEILLIALAGCLAGADNMVEMAGWARMNLEALRSIRPFARGEVGQQRGQRMGLPGIEHAFRHIARRARRQRP